MILYGEQLVSGPRGAQAARALLNVAERLGAKLLEIPAQSNGRGLREAGFLPHAGPGYAEPAAEGRPAREIAAALEGGDLSVLYLLRAEPLRTHPDRRRWERALHRATAVIAHDAFMNETLREYATVVFPAESHAEKQGTVTHPDGRVQRLRPAIGHAPGTRAEWQVIAELAQRVGHDLGVLTATEASERLFEAVPFYAGLSLELLGGRASAGPRPRRRSGCPPERARPSPWTPRHRLRRPTARCWWGPTDPSGPHGRWRPPRRCTSCTPRSSAWRPLPRRCPAHGHRARRPGGGRGQREPRGGHGRPPAPRSRRAGRSWRRPPPPTRPTRSPSRSPRSARWARDRHRRLLRALVDADPQGDRDLRGRPPARARRPAPRAQAAGTLPGPLRAQPGRSVRPPPAPGRHRQAPGQGAVPDLHLGGLPLRAGASGLHRHRGRRPRAHPLRRRAGHLRDSHRALRPRRLHRPPLPVRLRWHRLLRAHAGRMGLRGPSTRSWAPCGRPPSSSPTRSRSGSRSWAWSSPRGRSRSPRSYTPSRACGTSSRSSSAS